MDTLVPAHLIVSYYKLLARPEEYDGKRILVRGILNVSREENAAALYPNEESFRYRSVVDSVNVTLTSEQWGRFSELDGKYVAIEGTFKRISQPDQYAVAGTIGPVTRLLDFSEYYH